MLGCTSFLLLHSYAKGAVEVFVQWLLIEFHFRIHLHWSFIDFHWFALISIDLYWFPSFFLFIYLNICSSEYIDFRWFSLIYILLEWILIDVHRGSCILLGVHWWYYFFIGLHCLFIRSLCFSMTLINYNAFPLTSCRF